MVGVQFETQLVHFVGMHWCSNVGKSPHNFFWCTVCIIVDALCLVLQSLVPHIRVHWVIYITLEHRLPFHKSCVFYTNGTCII